MRCRFQFGTMKMVKRRDQWYHGNRANVINMGYRIGNPVFIRLRVKMVSSRNLASKKVVG